jgi:hypothetical protein
MIIDDTKIGNKSENRRKLNTTNTYLGSVSLRIVIIRKYSRTCQRITSIRPDITLCSCFKNFINRFGIIGTVNAI